VRLGAAQKNRPAGGVQEIVLPNNPHPRQLEFHKAAGKYRYRLYGGARSGGKSHAVRWDAIYHCLTWPGTVCLILRRTYPELKKYQIIPILEELPGVLFKWSADDKILTFYNGSRIDFGYLDTEEDVGRYHGADYNLIYFDEVTQFTYRQWSKMIGSNRAKKGCKPGMIASGMPGGIGHAWVKALWITKDRKKLGVCDGLEPASYNPDEYHFTKSTVYDNPTISLSNPEYVESLKNLPPALRAAWLDGNWDLVAGQYFDCWGEHCLIEPPKERFPSWYRRWASIDWGYAHEAAVYWHVSDPDGKSVITYREFVVRRTTPPELAHAIADLTEPGEPLDAIYLSPDAYARRTAEATIALEMNEVFWQRGLPEAAQAQDNRVSGWSLMHAFLKAGRWKIVRPDENEMGGCPKLIDTMPLAQRDEKNQEDVIKFDGDDPLDAARYGIATRWLPRTTPADVELERRLSGITDYTSKFIYGRQIAAELRKRDQPIILGRRVA
jgi:phage terminase large subunit